jgi:hypothetical protein
MDTLARTWTRSPRADQQTAELIPTALLAEGQPGAR